MRRHTRRTGRADEADDETASEESRPGSTTARGWAMLLTWTSAPHSRWILQILHHNNNFRSPPSQSFPLLNHTSNP